MSEAAHPQRRPNEPIDISDQTRRLLSAEPGHTRPRAERLSGRQLAIARAAELVEQATSALLVGPNGSGKSYAVDRIGRSLQAAGRPVQSTNARSGDCFTAIERWRDSPSGSVLIIDDGASLPTAIVPTLIELTRSHGHAALITLEPGDGDAFDGPRDERSTARLLSAWRSGSLKRIDLPALDQSEAGALATHTAEGSVLDDMAKATIVRLSNGSPLLVTELTKDALETGGGFYRPRSILSLGTRASRRGSTT